MKLIKQKLCSKRLVAFTNGIISYGKNFYNQYRIEMQIPFIKTPIKLYESTKKPIFKNISVLTAVLTPIIPLVIVGLVIMGLINIYITGAINFYRDKAWQDNVREFNWVNIVLVILLTIAFIFKR
ncbi:MAG: hypothetical protein JEY96_16870 [Bacteroidales bacterium]|nr:hypothetical protein [Bacteroidales bacterium]